jgi:ribonuclease T2
VPTLRISTTLLVLTALAAAVFAQAPAAFDYYVLSLSWAPSYCEKPNAAKQSPEECAVGNHIGFIVHGLWPESNSGQNPENCPSSTRLPNAVINYALPIMLSRTLIQHEWTTHGTCTGLAPFDFFSLVAMARSAVQIPVQITSIVSQTTESPGQIETQFATANPSFPKTAFRTSCQGNVFEEMRVCFDKNIKPLACTATVSECRNTALTIRPPL